MKLCLGIMKSSFLFKDIIYKSLLISIIFSFVSSQTQAGEQILYDYTYAIDSGKMVLLNSTLAAVRIIEWEGEKDSCRMVVTLSPHLETGILIEDFFEFVKLDFTETIAGHQWEFYIADAPAYWWKKLFGLKDKIPTEVFLIDLYLPKKNLLLDVEISNGSLNTFNGFPISMQIQLNDSEANLSGSYWTLLMQLESSKLEVESANSILLTSSYSEVKVFHCNSLGGSGIHSNIALSSAGTVEFNGEFCKLQITYAGVLSCHLLNHSTIIGIFVGWMEVNVIESDINIWYLMQKLDLTGERVDMTIRHLGSFIEEVNIQGKKIHAHLGRDCNNGYVYNITALDTEVYLPCSNLYFEEKKEFKSGRCGDSNFKKGFKLNLDIENSKFYLCKEP